MKRIAAILFLTSFLSCNSARLTFEYYACRDVLESNYFNGGNGSPGNPYLVCSAAHLNRVRNFPTAYFLQVKDIDLSASANGQASNWFSPIEGTSIVAADKSNIITTNADPSGYNFFSGFYDGGGFKIKNFNYTPTSDAKLLINGLFSVNLGNIYNVVLRGATVHGSAQTGALVGINLGYIYGVTVEGSILNHQSLSAPIANDDQGLGLISGANLGVIIESRVSNSQVLGATATYIGGLSGLLVDQYGSFSSQIYYSQVEASIISGLSDVGGAVGYVGANGAEYISGVAVLSTSVTSSTSSAGGLVGALNNTLDSSSVTNSTITTLTNYAGGLVGVSSGGSISNSTADTVTTIGDSYVGGALGGGSGTFTSNSITYGVIQSTGTGSGGFMGYENALSNYSTIDISNTNVYTTSADAGGAVGVSRGDSNYTNVQVNSGVVSGGATSDSLGGFFGSRATLGGGTLTNCDVSQTDVTGRDNVGGFIGYNSSPSAINDATVMGGTITSTGNKVGGFAGYNNGSISSSSVDGTTVDGIENVGGFVGYIIGRVGQQITQCHSSNIYLTSTKTSGGFVGTMIGSVGNVATITRSYVNNPAVILNHTAAIYPSYLGGFAGLVYDYSSITRSYVDGNGYLDGNGSASGGGTIEVSAFMGSSSGSNISLSDLYVNGIALSGSKNAVSSTKTNGFSGSFTGTETRIYSANIDTTGAGAGVAFCPYSCTVSASTNAQTYYEGAGDASGRATAKITIDFITSNALPGINDGSFPAVWDFTGGTFPTLYP